MPRMKLKLIFTLDYEIHGNGDGSPLQLMVKPTWRLIRLMEKYGARITIFADMAEIARFKEYFENTGDDKFHYRDIKEQLQQAVLRGHNVQLHIHSSYMKAIHDGRKWQQHWPEYNMASLSFERIDEMIKSLKGLLELMIREVVPDYTCNTFRAANWSMQPTHGIAKALLKNGISIDSSVYKHGRQSSWAVYDYSDAADDTFPYRADTNNICLEDSSSQLWEFPIQTRMVELWSLVSVIRIFRAIRAQFHRHKHNRGPINQPGTDSQSPLKGRHPRKLDFNQLQGFQMIRQLKGIQSAPGKLPYVTLIGHSKSFIPYNTITLRRFLSYISRNSDKYRFATFPASHEL